MIGQMWSIKVPIEAISLLEDRAGRCPWKVGSREAVRSSDVLVTSEETERKKLPRFPPGAPACCAAVVMVTVTHLIY